MNISPLFQRVLTALVLIPIIVAIVIYATPILFAIISMIFLLMASKEWLDMMNIKPLMLRIAYMGLLILIAKILYQTSFVTDLLATKLLLSAALIWWILAFFSILQYSRHPQLFIMNPYFLAILGLFVLMFSWFGLMCLRVQINGPLLILYLFVLTWCADIGAYFSGRFWGKKKLLVTVSPNKTWVGLCGGLVLGLIWVLLAPKVLSLSIAQYSLWIIWSTFTLLISVVGDLFISVLKRSHHLKDTGSLLPGHGGVLDRIDSLLATIPVFTFGILYVLR
ncbi:MAG: phosphatidate cytidylyltransferase [Gammaproteobacteria bacterium]